MVTESDYREAARNPLVRQDFLNAIDLEEAKEYICKVVYEPVDIEGTPMRLIAPLLTKIFTKRGLKSKIEVLPNAFSYLSFNYFMNGLIDHEGFHARQVYEIPAAIKKVIQQGHITNIGYPAIELPTYENQRLSSRFRFATEHERSQVHEKIYICHKAINDESRGNSLKELEESLSCVIGNAKVHEVIKERWRRAHKF